MNTSEKVHPTSKKPPTVPTTTTKPTTPETAMAATKTATTTTKTATPSPKFQPTKTQQLPTPPRYKLRPPPALREDRHRHHYLGGRRRQCCTCRCCFFTLFWITLIIIALLVAATAAAAVFYTVYAPQPPSFSYPSLKIAQFNLTSPTLFNTYTKFNLSLTTTNPNKKITFYYNPINFTIFAEKGGIEIGQGTFPSFVHSTDNTKLLFATITNKNPIADDKFEDLQNDMKKKIMTLQVKIETKVKVKISDKVKSNNVGVNIVCDGFKVLRSKSGKFTTQINGNEICKVKYFIMVYELEIPIWRFYSKG